MWKIFGRDDWNRRWIKNTAMLCIFLVSIFWFKQFELAKLFKGIANMVDVWQMVGTGILAIIALRVFWKLISNRKSREIIRRLVAGNEFQIALLVLGIIAISELAILFLLVVPSLYQLSIWSLISG